MALRRSRTTRPCLIAYATRSLVSHASATRHLVRIGTIVCSGPFVSPFFHHYYDVYSPLYRFKAATNGFFFIILLSACTAHLFKSAIASLPKPGRAVVEMEAYQIVQGYSSKQGAQRHNYGCCKGIARRGCVVELSTYFAVVD